MEFCRRSLAGGNVCDSLADLLKIMKLRGVGADDVKEVLEIVQHLFTKIVKPARSKRDSRQAKMHVDNLVFQLVDDMHSMWNADSFLDRTKELVKKGRVLSVQRREPSDESKTTAAIDRHDFHQCRVIADPRYAGRLDDKQGGDTIVTMERVREAIAFYAELADESTWLWLTSEQMGFSFRWGRARGESRGFRHQPRGT